MQANDCARQKCRLVGVGLLGVTFPRLAWGWACGAGNLGALYHGEPAGLGEFGVVFLSTFALRRLKTLWNLSPVFLLSSKSFVFEPGVRLTSSSLRYALPDTEKYGVEEEEELKEHTQ